MFRPFFYVNEQFWITIILDKYQGAFVCVYDQNYALAIITQLKKEECAILSARETQCQSKQKNMKAQYVQTGTLRFHLSFHFTKPLLSGPKYFWTNNCLDKCSGTFLCVYNKHYALVLVTQPNQNVMCNPLRQEYLVFIYCSILQNHF